jgi:hypothetical protein
VVVIEERALVVAAVVELETAVLGEAEQDVRLTNGAACSVAAVVVEEGNSEALNVDCLACMPAGLAHVVGAEGGDIQVDMDFVVVVVVAAAAAVVVVVVVVVVVAAAVVAAAAVAAVAAAVAAAAAAVAWHPMGAVFAFETPLESCRMEGGWVGMHSSVADVEAPG